MTLEASIVTPFAKDVVTGVLTATIVFTTAFALDNLPWILMSSPPPVVIPDPPPPEPPEPAEPLDPRVLAALLETVPVPSAPTPSPPAAAPDPAPSRSAPAPLASSINSRFFLDPRADPHEILTFLAAHDAIATLTPTDSDRRGDSFVSEDLDTFEPIDPAERAAFRARHRPGQRTWILWDFPHSPLSTLAAGFLSSRGRRIEDYVLHVALGVDQSSAVRDIRQRAIRDAGLAPGDHRTIPFIIGPDRDRRITITLGRLPIEPTRRRTSP